MFMKTILAIETSTSACSVALSYQGQVHQIFEMLPQKHAHRVLEMVDELLKEHKVDPQQIDYLAFGEGPGAFTGIRIATGVVQGLALGWNKPVISISSLEALAFSGLDSSQLLQKSGVIEWTSLMDARMQEIYLQTGEYDIEHNQWLANEPELLSEQAIKDAVSQRGGLIFGDVQSSYPDLVSELEHWHESLPSAKAVVHLALMKVHLAKTLQQQVPLPVYLRNNVAETIAERKAKKAAN